MRAIILGAGASKAYGDSISKQRMPIATDFFKTYNQLAIAENPWVLVGNFINYLRDFHKLSPHDFHSYNADIEQIHSEIEDKLFRALHDTPKDFFSIPNNYKYFKSYTELIFLFSNVINEIQNGPISAAHVNLAKKLTNDDIVVTFNWDTLMDRALESTTNWNCFNGYYVKPVSVYDDTWCSDNGKNSGTFPTLLKLHGSTNWLTGHPRPELGKIKLSQEIPADNFFVYRSNVSPYSTYKGRYMDGYSDFSYGYYPPHLPIHGEAIPEGFLGMRVSFYPENMPKGTADSQGIDSIPLIIPPVKHKNYSLFGDLFSVLWNKAEDAISQADEIVIIGYSFPETDYQSDSLFRKAFVRRNSIPKIIIVNPDPKRVEERFKHDYGIPESHLQVIPEYFSESFDIARIL